ncbi:putative major structural protein [Sulfolobales Beppu virus 1]|nr:putative major structural protein [Sulfolobales Beppu virus 1]
MARHGKYKNKSPDVASELAFQKYLEKAPQMQRGYDAYINRLLSDANFREEIASQYTSKLAMWIRAMRNPQVRNAIRNAVNIAKQQYDAELERVEGGMVYIPQTVTATTP